MMLNILIKILFEMRKMMAFVKGNAMNRYSFKYRIKNTDPIEKYRTFRRLVAGEENFRAALQGFAGQASGVHFGPRAPFWEKSVNDENDSHVTLSDELRVSPRVP